MGERDPSFNVYNGILFHFLCFLKDKTLQVDYDASLDGELKSKEHIVNEEHLQKTQLLVAIPRIWNMPFEQIPSL